MCLRWMIILCTGILVLLSTTILATDTLYLKCDPDLPNGSDHCPAGYCCVRDQFRPTSVYCQQMGQRDDLCSVQVSEHHCPCATGFTCKANIHTAVFVSMFGHCVNATLP